IFDSGKMAVFVNQAHLIAISVGNFGEAEQVAEQLVFLEKAGAETSLKCSETKLMKLQIIGRPILCQRKVAVFCFGKCDGRAVLSEEMRGMAFKRNCFCG